MIAGDLVDFVGMSVSPASSQLDTELNDEEQVHGLGSSVDHTLAKLRQVAEHHRAVFSAIARFVAAGNSLVVVRGNHDVDFHWEPVQRAFRDALADHAEIQAGSVELADWFYYEEGRVFIEHGHQYDEYCSYDHLLHPVLPSDPRRSYRSLSDILLRYVVRPTRGMREAGHEAMTALGYFGFGVRLGVRGLLGLGSRFAVAVGALFGLRREHLSDAARWVQAEHERKMKLLAEARNISLLKLRALASLQRPPVTRSLLGIVAGVMLDRVALGLMAAGLLVWALAANWTLTFAAVLGVALASLWTLGWLLRRTRGALDASDSLREGAQRVAKLFPAAFIVMGHTHLPEVHQADEGAATYVNLGAWSEEEASDSDGAASPPPSRTHLVLSETGEGLQAVLMRWDESLGPQRFVGASADPDASAPDAPAANPTPTSDG